MRETPFLNDISESKKALQDLPQKLRLSNEIVLSLRLHPEFSAKSYYPRSLFDGHSENFGLVEIGSRVWRGRVSRTTLLENEGTIPESSKLFFVRATEESLNKLEGHLHESELHVTKGFKEDVRKVSSFGFLSAGDQITGLPEGWERGELEAVLHPFDIDQEQVLEHFLKRLRLAGVRDDTVRFKQYPSGVSFVNFMGDQQTLDFLKMYNPLRTLHPLKFRSLPDIPRSKSISYGPKAPEFRKKPEVVVGVIDGGLDISNPYTKNFAEAEFAVGGNMLHDYVQHGTMVTGMLLYGPLNKYTSKDVLPEPKVSVKNFGVLSSKSTDPNLYEAIDAIEDTVPANKDIKVYNLSLGPSGPIYDDNISRFTYACDKLSYENNVLFCIAVGNDGDVQGYERIQSPSDSVNCLAVGAYTKIDGDKLRAFYSSIGPGREGNKMKPDVMAFGGCDQSPVHLISPTEGRKVLSYGTSFASPIVASVAGQLIADSNSTIDSLIAKALLVHSAESTKAQRRHCLEIGHGYVPEEIDKIVTCEDKSYTLIYRGEITPGKYAQFPVPWDESIVQGKAEFQWTVAVLSDVDYLSPDDYTTSSVEVTFYPNRSKYKFVNVKGVEVEGVMKGSEIVDVVTNSERATLLLEHGWKQSGFPITDAPKTQFRTEGELREDLKWDSIDTRQTRKQAENVLDPAFHVHALGRGFRNTVGKVKFALILSVTAPKAEVDLYSSILNQFGALIPLQITSEVNTEIQIGSKE